MIFQGDREHGPPHVHAYKSGAEIVIYLSAVTVRSIKEMGNTDARRALEIAHEHRELLLTARSQIND